MLEVSGLSVSYGHVAALDGVSLAADLRSVTTIIGSNGAGKSTLLRTVSGLLRPLAGEIRFMGERIDRDPPARVVSRGISQVPEGRALFPRMSVTDNLLTGAHLRRDGRGIRRDLDKVYHYFPILREKARTLARDLSGGQQQMLAFARALMAAPRMLLLDEPSTGLAPVVEQGLMRVLADLARSEGLGIVLVEQNAAMALQTAQRGYVLELGRMVLDGPASAMLRNRRVREAYLGA